MSTEAATTATTETPKADAIATTTSPDSIKAELDKVSGHGIGGAKGALALASQGVVLNSLDDAWRFATIIQSTGLAPKDLNTPAKILLAMQMGMEVGLPPMAAIQNIAVINGRPSLWGDICLALARKSGYFDEEAFEQKWEMDDQGNVIKATCIVRRLPNGKPIVSEFTWREAIAAKLDAKDTYKSYRKRMLMNRARAFALRDGFGDVLKGVLIAEEAQDLPERNITPQPSNGKPESLEELTEALTASEPVAETPIAETPAPAEQEPAKVETASNDPLAGIKVRLQQCTTVPDVTRLQNTLAGPAARLTDLEKLSIDQVCEARKAEIRAARK